MNYWLVKSDPDTYGWEHLVKEKKTDWTGVRNYQARNNLKAMKKGDPVLFYHSGEGMDVVGITKVTKEFFPDTTTKDGGDWVAVELTPVKKVKKSVTLNEIRATKQLSNIHLVRNARLSVMPLQKEEFDTILEMAETKL
jgi:predicted RNA-binding protein with PUA-like domain